MYTLAVWTLALLLTAVAAVTDARTGRIPNWLTLAGIVMAFAIHAFVGMPGLLLALAGLSCGVMVPALLFLATQGRAMGGGDVKLFAALGATLGPLAGLEVQLLSYWVLLFFALCRLSYQGKLVGTLKGALALLLHRVFPKRISPAAPEAMTALRLGPSILVACAAMCAYRNLPVLQLWL